MSDIAYDVQHSVEAAVSLAFAWDWRTDVRNWHDPPATFRLEGPFVAGSWGTTVIPGQDALRWHIREVIPGRSFVIEMPLDGATLSFEWLFDGVSDRRTKLTQRVQLSGANAGAHAEQVKAGFSATLENGMDRIAKAMATAESVSKACANLDDFSARFVACRLSRDEWTHQAHLMVGAWHVHRYGTEEALTRLRSGIRRLNESFGNVNSATNGYHETITRAYVQLLSQFLDGCPDDMPLAERVKRLLASHLADRDVLFTFYSHERLMSRESRADWAEPDIAPLGHV
jgi:hypothetical protein